MGVGSGPTVGRRQLAQDLRRHRAAAGRTIEDVARHLECSPAKVSRIETGAVKVGVHDLRAILELYGIDGPQRDELFALVRQARERGWWQAFADVVPANSGTFYGLEDGATSISQHSVSLVPGLLQTEAYARALIGSVPGAGPEWVDRRVQLRMRRQQLLGRADPPTLNVVLDEAVLWRMIGGPEIMTAQLGHLLERGAWPHVTVQVLPFTAGAHAGAGVSFTVFGFANPPDAPVVYREQLDSNNYLDQPDHVTPYTGALAQARDLAATVERSHELIAARRAVLQAGR